MFKKILHVLAELVPTSETDEDTPFIEEKEMAHGVPSRGAFFLFVFRFQHLPNFSWLPQQAES
jgi:hypothetical protein